MRLRVLKLVGLILVPIFFFYFYLTLYEVPILMYHRVESSSEKSSIRVSPEAFERQMEFLKVHHYRVVPLRELLTDLKSGRSIPWNTVTITFDDGTLDNFKNAFPVLKKMNFPATIFMITDNINKQGWLSEEDLRILDESGIAIGSHTTGHAFLPKLSPEEIKRELKESQKRLEEILGHPVDLLSYPAGGVTPVVRAAAQSEGYLGALTTNYGKTKNDLYALHRIKISEGRGYLFNFWVKLSGFYHLGKKRIEIL